MTTLHALAVALLLAQSGGAKSAGKMSPTSDVSNNRVKATGSTTARAIKDWMADFDVRAGLNVRRDPYNASGYIARTATTGALAAGATTIGVGATSGFTVGQQVMIALAGTSPGKYSDGTTDIPAHHVATITAVGASSLTITPGLGVALPTADYPVWTLGTTTTVGTTAPGTSVSVSTAATFSAGQGVLIPGAGAAGGSYVGTISLVAGTTLTVSPAITTSVPAGTLVRHDDSAAFQSAINALAATGGTIIIPNGFYQINGPLQDTGAAGANAILALPKIAYWPGSLPNTAAVLPGTGGIWVPPITITLAGATSGPPHSQNYMYHRTIPLLAGTILATDGTSGNLIGGRYAGGLGDYTNVRLTVRDMTIRVPENPGIQAVNADYIASFDGRRLNFDTTTAGLPAQPTNANGIALTLPHGANSMLVFLEDCQITGYYLGVRLSENAKLHGVDILATYQGIKTTDTAGWGIQMDNVAVQGSAYGLVAGTLAQSVRVDRIQFEHSSANVVGLRSWMAPVADVYDPSSLLRGTITYDASVPPTVVGAKYLAMRPLRMASSPAAELPAWGGWVGWQIGFPEATGSEYLVADHMTVAQDGDRVVIASSSVGTPDGSNYGQGYKVVLPTFVGRSFAVRVIHGVNAQTHVGMALNASNFVILNIESNQLKFQRVQAGAWTTVASATYDPSTHAHLRIRENGGTLYADVSSDGAHWSQFGSTTVTWSYATNPVVYVAIVMSGIVYAGYTVFDRANQTPDQLQVQQRQVIATPTALVASGMIGDFDLYGGSGTRVANLSGYGGAVTLGGGPYGHTAPIWTATALTFAGTNGVYGPPLIAVPFSLQVLVSQTGAQYHTLVDADSAAAGLIFRISNTNHAELVKRATVTIGTGTGIWTGVNLLTVTYDGTNWAFYRSGAADGSGANAQTLDTGANNILGSTTAPGTESLAGTLYHVIAYNRVLSPSEVTANYTYLKALWATRGVTIP